MTVVNLAPGTKQTYATGTFTSSAIVDNNFQLVFPSTGGGTLTVVTLPRAQRSLTPSAPSTVSAISTTTSVVLSQRTPGGTIDRREPCRGHKADLRPSATFNVPRSSTITSVVLSQRPAGGTMTA